VIEKDWTKSTARKELDLLAILNKSNSSPNRLKNNLAKFIKKGDRA
jgi:hypothetical protein